MPRPRGGHPADDEPPQTTPSSCPTSFENNLGGRAGQEAGQVRVRNLLMVVVPLPLTPRSKATADYRCYEDASRHRQRVSRCVPSPQIVFGRRHCTHQTLRSRFLLDNAPTPLTASYQQSKDVGDKLADLIPWLTKLKDTMSATADGNHEEAKRREILTQCVAPSSF